MSTEQANGYWWWAQRLWALFGACVVATAVRSPTTKDFRHLVDDLPLANLTLLAAAAAGLATALACGQDRTTERPDALGTRALAWTGSSVFLCCVIGALETPVTGGCLVFPLLGAMLLPLALGPAGLMALWALRSDRDAGRAWMTMGLLCGLLVMLIGLMENKTRTARRVGPQRDYQRACYGNQKMIASAVEMYNYDKNTKRVTLDGAFFEALRSGGYIQAVPEHPGPRGSERKGQYQSTDAGNGVRCTEHGRAPAK